MTRETPPRPTLLGRGLAVSAKLAAITPDSVVMRLAGGPPDLRGGSQIDPTVLLGLKVRAALGIEPSFDVATRRAQVRADAAWAGGRPEPVGAIRAVGIPGPAGRIPARLYLPDVSSTVPRPLLVFFHGGGWVSGDLDTHDQPCRILARTGQMAVLSVGYRLAPEHPFPASVEDSVAALSWALENAAQVGCDPARVAVGGDSAGGNLAAVSTQYLRDSAQSLPAAQLLVYPATTRDGAWESRRLFEEGYYLSAEDMRWYYELYSGDVSGADPSLSPLQHPNLTGLPPAVVVTAECDYLRDEGEAYVAALRGAGVRVSHHRAVGMIHGFINTTAAVPSGRDALVAAAGAIRGTLDVTAA